MNKEACPRCGGKVKQMKKPRYLAYTYYYNIARRKTKGVIAKTVEEKKVDKYLSDFIGDNITISASLHSWAMSHLSSFKDKVLQ